MLGQVVINDQRVFAAVAEVLAHRAAGIRCQVLHGGRVRSGGGHDDGVFHRAVLFQLAHHVGDRRSLLADCHVDAEDALALLVDDGVDSDGGLAGLAVANDQLTLATADRHHRVDRLQAGLHRLAHRLTRDHARRDLLDHVGFLRVDRALAVDRLAQRVDHAAQQFATHRHFQNAAGALHRVAFGNVFVVTQHHGAHGVTLQVQRQAKGVAGEFQHLALHHAGQAVHAADTIGHGDHRAGVAHFSVGAKTRDAGLDQLADF
ncbi:hypothetical protein D3C72_1104610 [compost metagenome]